MKNAAYAIKALILVILLAFESYYLTTLFIDFVKNGNFFAPQLTFMASVVVFLLLISYTFTLTVGAWKTWEQYLIAPAPIALGIFLPILSINSNRAFTILIVSFLLMVMYVYASARVKDQMIKFNPVIVFRFAVKGILLIFSLLAAVLVLMLSAGDPKLLNIGDTIGELAQNYSENIIAQPNLEGFVVNVKTPVSQQVSTMLEPYGNFVTPFIAVLIFALIRFLGGISHIFYIITIGVVIKIFTKMGFLHMYEVQVQKEEISFESPST